MQALLQDLRYARRQMLKSPGFTGLAVLSLALGIGANAAIFTAVENVLLRPLPYVDSSQLLSIVPTGTEAFATSWLNYRDIRDQSQTLQSVAAYSEDVGVIKGKDGSLTVVTPGVTPNLFTMLGAKPLLGRTFTEEEGRTGGPLSVIFSEGLWREQFGADSEIIGKNVRVNGQTRTVVGVMAGSFRFPEPMGQDLGKGLWLPLQPTSAMLTERDYSFLYVLGAMKPGVSLSRVQEEVDSIGRRIRQVDPRNSRNLELRAAYYQSLLTGPVRPVLTAFMIALGLVLLIGCANVANLLIARCLGRQQEFALRAALGASRRRLLQQVFVEGGLLSVAGCVVGLAFANFALDLVHKLPPDTFPRSEEIAIHWTLVLVLAVIGSLTTILSSLLPALLVARTDSQPVLHAASRGLGSRMRSRTSAWLVAGEVALSTTLLVATGLLFQTLWNLEHARLGFDVTRVTSFSAMPADAVGFSRMGTQQDTKHTPPSISTLIYQPLLVRMQETPGVQYAALVSTPPLSGIEIISTFRVVGRSDDPEHVGSARLTAVSGKYALVMGTPVVRGRMISDDDTASAPYVVAINETLAHRYFAGEDPLGRQLQLENLKDKNAETIKPYTIVGIIGDQVDAGVSQPPHPLLMFPYQQIPTTSLVYPALLKTIVSFVVKTRSDIPIAPAMRLVFKQIAPDFAVENFHTMQQAIEQNNFNDRLGLYLISSFAGLAVLMVVGGLYGVLTQLVNYRRREIAIRLALGATRQSVLAMFLRQGFVLVVAGLVVGLVLAFAAGRFLKSFLFGVGPVDMLTYSGVTALLAVVGISTALLPARRAASAEPLQALREE